MLFCEFCCIFAELKKSSSCNICWIAGVICFQLHSGIAESRIEVSNSLQKHKQNTCKIETNAISNLFYSCTFYCRILSYKLKKARFNRKFWRSKSGNVSQSFYYSHYYFLISIRLPCFFRDYEPHPEQDPSLHQLLWCQRNLKQSLERVVTRKVRRDQCRCTIWITNKKISLSISKEFDSCRLGISRDTREIHVS